MITRLAKVFYRSNGIMVRESDLATADRTIISSNDNNENEQRVDKNVQSMEDTTAVPLETESSMEHAFTLLVRK